MRPKPLIALTALLALAAVLAGCTPTPEAQTGSTTTGSATTSGTTSETPATTPEPEKPPVTFATEPKEGEEVAVLETSKGQIVLMFYPEVAPKHVESFKKLVKDGFYNGTRFHRCIPGFMIQGGDPNSKDLKKAAEWGQGGPDFSLAAEFNELKHTRGVLSMARSADPNSAGSQFFVMHADNSGLDGQYTGFGRAVKGLEVVDEIVKTGSPDPSQNGAVNPEKAVVLKTARLATWPL